MARISISIPESLMAKLEPIKDRINISQLCREALEQQVNALEGVAESSEEVEVKEPEDTVARLREEAEDFERRFDALGRDGASAWLGAATYSDVKTVTDADDPASMAKYRLPRAAFKIMKREMKGAGLDCEGPHALTYKKAWLDHVSAVWAEVIKESESTDSPEAAEAPEASDS